MSISTVIEDCGIKLVNTNALKYEFENNTEITERGFRILYELPRKRAIRFQTDDGTEDYVTLTILKELSKYQYFTILSEGEHVHYIIDLDLICEI